MRALSLSLSASLAFLSFLAGATARAQGEPQNIVTVAGRSSTIGDGGPATLAQLSAPRGVAVDSSGNVYIADQGHQCIRKIGPGGTIATVVGTGVLGATVDTDPATGHPTAREANLGAPQAGMVFDSMGNLYFAEASAHRVRRVKARVVGGVPQPLDGTEAIQTVAGTGVAGVGGGNGGPATAAQINTPRGIALAPGSLYIAENGGHRIRRVDLATGVISLFAGTGIAGYNGDLITATAARINIPFGLAFSSGSLYIADSANHRVRRVDVSTGIISTFVGTGTAGFSGDGGLATAAKINTPFGLAFSSSGSLFLVDQRNLRVRKVDLAGTITTVAGSSDTPALSGDGGPATEAQLNNCQGLAFGPDLAAELYIADTGNNRVRKVDFTTGKILAVAGCPDGFNGDTDPATGHPSATEALLNTPFGATADLRGSPFIYIADAANDRVRRVDLAAGTIRTVVGTGEAGFSGDGVTGTAATAKINKPRGLAFDPEGNLYVSDSGNGRIRRVTARRVGGVTQPIDGTEPIETIAGTGMRAYGGDDGPALQADLNVPRGLAFGSGSLYIADNDNHRIRRIDPSGIVTTIAGTGASGFSGDDGPATAAQIANPHGVSVDTAGDVYVPDFNNNRIRKVDFATGKISTVAGTGVAGSAGDGDAATAAQVANPRGVDSDPEGSLYIASGSGHCIRRVDGATETIATVAGTGAGGFSGDGGPAGAAQLNDPEAIRLDPSGNLYITDQSNNRIRRLNLAADVHFCPDVSADLVLARIEIPTRFLIDVDIATLTLQAIDPVTREAGSAKSPVTPGSDTIGDEDGDGVPDLTVQFDRPAASLFPAILRVEGRFHGGRYFSGDVLVASAEIDTTPPTITGPGAPVLIECGGPETSVPRSSVTPADECDPHPAVTFMPSSVPYVRPEVAQSVTAYATDDSGNVSASITFSVIVVDTTPPSLALPASRTAEATSSAGAAVDYPPATATDVASTPAIAYSIASGSTFPLGTTTIQVTATDAAGNPSSGGFTVTVRDTTPPALTLLGANPLTIPAAAPFVDPGATASDAVAGDLTGAIQASGTVDVNVPGTYTRSYLVSDGAQTAQATRTVVVEPPVEIVVALNVQPRRNPNVLRVKEDGHLVAAILGQPDLDVRRIDKDSVTLEGIEPEHKRNPSDAVRARYEDVGTPSSPVIGRTSPSQCNAAGPDGREDLVMRFDRDALIDALERRLGRPLRDDEVLVLHLAGRLTTAAGGNPIRGEDVVIVNRPKKR